MTAIPLTIRGIGMVSGVGLTAAASCAAIRSAVDNFQETRFIDADGERIIGSMVPLKKPWRGAPRLARFLASAITECVASDPQPQLGEIPLLLCLPEQRRPGRSPNLGLSVVEETEALFGTPFHARSRLIEQGRVALVTALYRARELLIEEKLPSVIVAGVDSMLSGATLRGLEENDRILTTRNSDGFIPGEAAAALLLQKARKTDTPQLMCLGLGWAEEQATRDSALPLRADGLVRAMKSALHDSGLDLGAMDLRVTDLSGEQYGFKEAALALTRILRKRKVALDIWHPADCIGEVGAAIGPAILALLCFAMEKSNFSGKKILCHLGNDDGKRAAMVLAYQSMRAT